MTRRDAALFAALITGATAQTPSPPIVSLDHASPPYQLSATCDRFTPVAHVDVIVRNTGTVATTPFTLTATDPSGRLGGTVQAAALPVHGIARYDVPLNQLVRADMAGVHTIIVVVRENTA